MKLGVHAQKGHGFFAPRFSPMMLNFLVVFGELYGRVVLRIGGLHIFNMEPLYQAFLDFQAKRTRLILIFRHVSKVDGPLVLQTVLNELARWCRKTRNPLPGRPHTQFLYGKDVLNWAGAPARWAFPRMAGIPVVNGRLDRRSHMAILEALRNGRFPLALAPEGQVTYHSYHMFDFTPGTSTLAAWTHRDLRREGREEHVVVLPLAIGYRYSRNMSALVDSIIRRLDAQTGLSTQDRGDPRVAMLETTEYLIDSLETSLQTDYPQIVHLERNLDAKGRIDQLCDQMLRCHEVALGLDSQGSILDRIFAVRNWVMDSLHREDLDPATLPPFRRALADSRAQIAAGLETHQLIADVLEYVDPAYISAGCSQTRLVEYGLNLLDVCNRTAGGNIESRYCPRGIVGQLLFGSPIDASARFEGEDGPSKAAIAALTDEIRGSFEGLIVDLEKRVESV